MKGFRNILATLLLTVMAVLLILTVSEMPAFGEPGPAYNQVARHYLERSVQETGAVNVISAIILDYRAYDTLGEATVLFTGIAAVLAALSAHRQKRGGGDA